MKTRDAIEVFINSCRARSLAKETIRWYGNILEVFAQKYPRLPKSPSDIDAFLSSLEVGDERRHGYYRCLRAFYNLLHTRKQVFNVMDLMNPPALKGKLPRPLMLEELQQLLAYPHRPKLKAAIMFLVDTGCRVGELAALQLNDITRSPWGYIARVTGKTGTRLVPICQETYEALSEVLPLGFTTYRLRRLVKFAFEDARVPGSSINLRHSFGTYWEGDELILQHIMGHSRLETTQIYRALRIKRMADQHQQYSPLKMILGGTANFDTL